MTLLVAPQGVAVRVVRLLEMLERKEGGAPGPSSKRICRHMPLCGPDSRDETGRLCWWLYHEGPSPPALAMLHAVVQRWRARAAQEQQRQRPMTGAQGGER